MNPTSCATKRATLSSDAAGSRAETCHAPETRTIYLAVHRYENTLYYKRLDPEAFAILQALARGSDGRECMCHGLLARSKGRTSTGRLGSRNGFTIGLPLAGFAGDQNEQPFVMQFISWLDRDRQTGCARRFSCSFGFTGSGSFSSPGKASWWTSRRRPNFCTASEFLFRMRRRFLPARRVFWRPAAARRPCDPTGFDPAHDFAHASRI